MVQIAFSAQQGIEKASPRLLVQKAKSPVRLQHSPHSRFRHTDIKRVTSFVSSAGVPIIMVAFLCRPFTTPKSFLFPLAAKTPSLQTFDHLISTPCHHLGDQIQSNPIQSTRLSAADWTTGDKFSPVVTSSVSWSSGQAWSGSEFIVIALYSELSCTLLAPYIWLFLKETRRRGRKVVDRSGVEWIQTEKRRKLEGVALRRGWTHIRY